MTYLSMIDLQFCILLSSYSGLQDLKALTCPNVGQAREYVLESVHSDENTRYFAKISTYSVAGKKYLYTQYQALEDDSTLGTNTVRRSTVQVAAWTIQIDTWHWHVHPRYWVTMLLVLYVCQSPIDPHCFNAESYLIESLLNRDILIDSSPKFDYLLEEFSGETPLNTVPNPPELLIQNSEPEEEIRLAEKLSMIISSHTARKRN
ncbi:hypothetical protein Tco_0933077 [Tanacetum coccineum]